MFMSRPILLLKYFTAVIVLSIMAGASPAFSQTEAGSISGLITDPSGAVIPGANLTLIDIKKGVSEKVKTNSSGFYRFDNVAPGVYRVEVQREGFKVANITNLTVNTQDAREENVRLSLGSTSESITVEARGASIDTSGAAISTVVDQEFVKNIPLNGRTFQSLLLMTPGMVFSTGEQGQMSANGGRTDANTFSVDGVSANIGVGVQSLYDQSASGAIPGFNSFGGTQNLLSLDAMEEVRISTSTYSAEYGRQPGAQVSLVSKSGTKSLHGTVYDYLRNSFTDANDWFSDQLGKAQIANRQNDYGGTIGGPIRIPWLYDGGQHGTFFFFDYEGLQLALPQPSRYFSVPAACYHTTYFSRLNHQLQELVNAFPAPNSTLPGGQGTCPPDVSSHTGTNGQYLTGYDNYTNMNTEAVRLDHTFNSKWSVFLRANHSKSQGEVYTLGRLSRYPLETDTETLGVTTQFTSALSNTFRLNFSKNVAENNLEWTTHSGGTPIADIGSFLPTGAPSYAVPYFLIGGESYEVGPYEYHRTADWNTVDTLQWQLGRHALSFGADLRWSQPKYIDNGYIFQITLSLTSKTSNVLDYPNEGSGAVINSLPLPALVKAYSFFANDAWKLSDRLTVNYGLRWEINPPASFGQYSLPAFVNFPNVNTLALAPTGTPLYPTFMTQFAPRVGVAYQLRRGSSYDTVLRGGWGLYYDLGTGTVLSGEHNYPFSVTQTIALQAFPFANGVVPAVTLPTPITTPLPSAGFKQIQNLDGLPRTQQYSFGLEQQLGKSQLLSVSYVGNHGQRQLQRYQYKYLDGTTDPNIASGSTFFFTRNDGAAGGFSWYNGLQVSYKRTMAQGLQVLSNYTYSHAFDTGGNDSNILASNIPNNVSTEIASEYYGTSSYDRRHIFNFAIVYDVPKVHSQSTLVNVMGKIFTNGWVMSPNFKYQSGNPFSMTVNYDDVAGGTNVTTVRADRVQGQPLYISNAYNRGGQSYNPLAFAIPAADLQPNVALVVNGNTPQNGYTGPGLSQIDLALRRNFKLYERLSLQFSAEFFNLINHPNFLNPDGDVGYVFNTATYGPTACPGKPAGMSCDINSPDPTIPGNVHTNFFTQGTFGEYNYLANGVAKGSGPGSSFDISLNPRYSVGGPRSAQFALRLSF
jgi:hypothetical protein